MEVLIYTQFYVKKVFIVHIRFSGEKPTQSSGAEEDVCGG